MEFLTHYGLFAAESVTVVIAILVVAAAIASLASKNKSSGGLIIKSLNEHYDQLREILQKKILSKKEFKAFKKQEKKLKKSEEDQPKKRYFILEFIGDLRAKAAKSLREEVSAILTLATPEDEVIILIESPGGSVAGYGYAASQLQRLRAAKIPLTACIDKVAASGGYLMACVANRILASPFSYLGSIGVVAQVPNFHRFLKERQIDVEVLTAGEFKRTLTVFGENTEKGRQKFIEDLDQIHDDFKQHVLKHRPQLDLAKIATGEHWLGNEALSLGLVDELKTSDDYLMSLAEHGQLYKLQYKFKESALSKATHAVDSALQSGLFFKS